MNFTTYVCMVLLFVSVENAPASTSSNQTTSSEEWDATEAINGYLSVFLKDMPQSQLRLIETGGTVEVQDGLLSKVITRIHFMNPLTSKLQMIYGDVLGFTWENISVSLTACLGNSILTVSTEPFPIKLNLSIPQEPDNASVKYLGLHEANIKLISENIVFQPHIKNQFNIEFKLNAEAKLDEFVESIDHYKEGYFFANPRLVSFSHNTQQNYYFINTIPSTDYTLSNVTIKGLWNIKNITVDRDRPFSYNFLNIQFSGVRGTMVLIISSENGKSAELSFNADNIGIWTDAESKKIYFKFERYSVTDTKSNRRLMKDESKSIISRIESVIANSLEISVKNHTLISKYKQIQGL